MSGFYNYDARGASTATQLVWALGKIEELEKTVANYEYELRAAQRRVNNVCISAAKYFMKQRAEITNVLGVAEAFRERMDAAIARAERAEAALQAVCEALPNTAEYLDPPDGGDVSAAEQVRRMKAHRDRLRAEVEQARRTSQLHKDNHLAAEREIARLRAALLEEAEYCYGYAQKYEGKDDERAARHRERGDKLKRAARRE